MSIDYDQLAKFEKAIEKKYGPKAIVNPKSGWNKDKEEEFLKDLKRFYSPRERAPAQKIKVGDVLISKVFLDEKTQNTCPVCSEYSMSKKDDVYMTKFKCCMKCYFDYIDGREDRWASGWRPEKKDLNPKTA